MIQHHHNKLRSSVRMIISSLLCFEVGRWSNGPGVRNQFGSWSCHWSHQETSPQVDRGGGWGKTTFIYWSSPHTSTCLQPSEMFTKPSCVSCQIQYEISRVRQKMKELAVLHDKHMNRPTLDDSSEEEHAIEITTQEITQVIQCSEEIMLIFVCV